MNWFHLKINKTEAQIIEKLNNLGLEVEKVEPLKNELNRLGILNIDNTDSKQLIEMEDPSDLFIKVISNIEDSFDEKINIANIIIRNEWHTQINMVCDEDDNDNCEGT